MGSFNRGSLNRGSQYTFGETDNAAPITEPADSPTKERLDTRISEGTKYNTVMHPHMVQIEEMNEGETSGAAKRFGNPYDSLDLGSEDEETMKRKKGCCYYFLQLDSQILRPILIYKYSTTV